MGRADVKLNVSLSGRLFHETIGRRLGCHFFVMSAADGFFFIFSFPHNLVLYSTIEVTYLLRTITFGRGREREHELNPSSALYIPEPFTFNSQQTSIRPIVDNRKSFK